MIKRQAFNPFLPLNEYIPDGEPHVFGDRVYLYGSHDLEGGYTFCMQDYVVYSAPVEDLTNWRYEGVSYRASQDPNYGRQKFLFAPDVVKGNDGRFYLYYCMGGDYGDGGYTGPVGVAVSDSPAGKFEFLGYVRNKDGSVMRDYICFDPAVINDDGVVRLYYGTQYDYEERDDFDDNPEYLKIEMEMFGRSREEILSYRAKGDSIMGPIIVTLCPDMLTVSEKPRHLIDYRVKGTSFEAHPFFEGASIRKCGDTYYFIYSSWQNHELCYAVSKYPDRDFVFGGTIVSNGDIGFEGRKERERLNMTGTTHGSIECINNQWYVFYHRLTHKSDYSRQACAEKTDIDRDGKIKQVEVTSCGLNPGPLLASPGYEYPAVIACNITNGHMPHGSNSVYKMHFPNVTNRGEERFIGEIDEGTIVGFKYFDFSQVTGIEISARRETEDNCAVYDGPVRLDERCQLEMAEISEESTGEGEKIGYIAVKCDLDSQEIARIALSEDDTWQRYVCHVEIENGTNPLYLIYHGAGRIQISGLRFL
jgi:hypothetical protein